MKRTAQKIGFLVSCLGAFAASAGTDVERSIPVAIEPMREVPAKTFFAEPTSEVRFGLRSHQFNYAEELPAGKKSTESGILSGFTLGVARKFGDHSVEAYIDFTAGNTVFDGTTQGGIPVISTTQNSMIDIGALFAFDLYAENGHTIWEMYTGVQRRKWFRGMQYRENYLWYSSPVGIRYYQDLGPSFRLGMDLAANIVYGGTIDVALSDFSTAYGDSVGILGMRLGAKVAFPVELFRRSVFPVHVTPWLEYVGFSPGPPFPIVDGGGNSSGIAIEPGSTSVRLGLTLQTAFEI